MTIKNAFIEIFKKSMSYLGFNNKGKIFHKIVNNEVVELVSYVTFSNKRFTIQYEIFPLCCGYTIDRFMDGDRLNILVGSELSYWDRSMIDDNMNLTEWNNDENMFSNMSLALECCKANLFPYLSRIVNLKTCLEYRNKMYSFFGGVPLVYSFTYFVNLKLHNFDTAIKSRQALLHQNEEAFKINGFATDEQMACYLEIKNEFEMIYKAINNNDLSLIDKYLKDKEDYSRNTYIKNFCC